MFSLSVLQAINDWQRGGSAKQKKQRGQALKEAAVELEPQFRRTSLVCFRQIALDKGHLWKLGDRLHLAETVSAWTQSTEVATTFKGGVPAVGQGYVGVIFMHAPNSDEIVVNLDALYRDREFRSAIDANRDSIQGFADGIAKYGDSQAELVLDVGSIPLSDVYAFGGHSSSREELARIMLGKSPTPSDLLQFDKLLSKSGRSLGAHWVTGDAKDRISGKLLKTVETLRPHYPGAV
jgi:hypothetical protein